MPEVAVQFYLFRVDRNLGYICRVAGCADNEEAGAAELPGYAGFCQFVMGNGGKITYASSTHTS